MTATADDNFGVTKVEFHAGQKLIGTDTSMPYGVSWNTATGPDGTHTLIAKAYDHAGNVTSSIGITVTVDNTPPAASLVSPAANAYVRGTIPLEAAATDSSGVARVEIYKSSTLIGTDTTPPFTASWDTATVSGSSHWLTIKAYGTLGNVYSSFTHSFDVDNRPPTVAITSPQNGQTIVGNTTIDASANDNDFVSHVVFYDGTKIIGTATQSPYSVSWNTVLLPKGNHTLTAKAYDRAGNVMTSAQVTVTVL